jgi:hypothetical protein
MVQGGVKRSAAGKPSAMKKGGKSAKVVKAEKRASSAKKGNPVQLPKGKFRDDALDDRELSKAISKASEQKVAALVLTDGVKIQTKDLLQSGKELNRELRRKQLKKKVGRVKEKLRALEEKAEKEGLV